MCKFFIINVFNLKKKGKKMKKFLKVFVILFALPLTFLLASCDKQENLSQVSSKESVAALLSNDGTLISPIFNSKTKTVENVLSALSEDQIDFALQIMSENLATVSMNDAIISGRSYQNYYDLALTQYRSLRNVSLELLKKDLNEVTVEEYLDLLDNHLTDLYVNAVSIAPSKEIKDAVWGADISNMMDNDEKSCPSYYYGIPTTVSSSGSYSCLGYTSATNIGDTDCDYEFKFYWPYNYCPSSFALHGTSTRASTILNLGRINGRLHGSNYVSFLIGAGRISALYLSVSNFAGDLQGDWW